MMASAPHRAHRFPPPTVDGEGSIDRAWLQEQISAAELHLEENSALQVRLRERRGRNHDHDHDHDEDGGHDRRGDGDGRPAHRLDRLSAVKRDIDLLALSRDYTCATARPDPGRSLKARTALCTDLGRVLLRHAPGRRDGGGDSNDDKLELYGLIFDCYRSVHSSARAAAILSMRRGVRRAGYPACCGAVGDILDAFLSDIEDGRKDEAKKEEDDGDGSLPLCAACLIELQVMYDRVSLRLGLEGDDNKADGKAEEENRFDFVDELFRPIVDRVRYHFLDGVEEEDGWRVEGEARQREVRATSARLDRLPEWLFHYLRENVLTAADGTDEGPFDLVCGPVQSLIDVVCKSLDGARKGSDIGSGVWTNGESHYAAALHFLGEVVRLARHVLWSRGFFHHPTVVGDRSNPLLLCQAVEQTLLFDAFVQDLWGDLSDEWRRVEEVDRFRRHRDVLAMKNAGGLAPVQPPRLLDAFVTCNPSLLNWWVDAERVYALSTLLSPASPNADEADLATVTASERVPVTAEIFIALIHSIRCKANATSILHCRREIVAKVAVPLSMRFMDEMHERATTTRDLLLARRKGSALPSDDDLRRNVADWIDTVTGIHLAARALQHSSSVGGIVGLAAVPVAAPNRIDDDLERVGRSLERLRDAVADECAGSLAETILMERAGLASYLMRCPHMLSLAAPNAGSLSGADADRQLNLSPDLNEVWHVLSIVIKVCDDSLDRTRSTFASGGGCDAEPPSASSGHDARMDVEDILEFGPKTVKAKIAGRLEEKFAEIVLDPQGMTPEIGVGGARQVQHDILSIVGLFGMEETHKLPGRQVARCDIDAPQQCFEYLLDVINLMGMESKKFVSLRQVLCGLILSSSRDDEDRLLRYTDFEADGTILDEAQSMIRAKGFNHVRLEDVISVLNRRRV